MDKSSIDLTSPLLDAEQVKMLISSGGEEPAELIAEILGLFNEESQANLAALETGRNEGDASAVCKAAHALAGSSANIGAAKLWQAAKAVEQSAGNGKIPEEAVLTNLRNLLEQSLLEFRRVESALEKK